MKHIYLLIFAVFSFFSCNLSRTKYRANTEVMLPTIQFGSLVKITKDIDSLTYGDIILFEYDKDKFHQDEKNYIEINGPIICRIVALPLDSLSIEKDICCVNGKKDKTRLIKHGHFVNEYENEMPNGVKINILSMSHTDKEFGLEGKFDLAPIQIPADRYFIMGDNRSTALDSRKIGSIPRSRIIGKVIEITLPDGRIVSML